MSETLSRADKTQTAVIYELVLGEDRETLERLEVTILCAMRDRGAGVGPQSGEGALSQQEHVAFQLHYTFRDHGEVERFDVPRDVVKLLR